ncbi:HEAT repeat domain-containing protein [uncultured Algibacter sp.]|uniref:HEAT repeat domain-containing protein n=1 Tax=uncultured Algibacter sp. TaxID=298659 RepID=UPI00261E5C8E|nr:HEAT repeat domain-containing protein [uncultured Algibacter sp.]
MLHQIIFFLFKLRLIQPSEKTIILWEQTEQVDKLEYALKHGNYKTRKLAAEALEHVGKPSSIPALLNCIYDKVHNVSLACLNALERINPSEEIVKNVIRKRFIWDKETREKDTKYQENRNKKHKIYRWERASKKSFDRVKEQLKRPMR